MSKVRSRKMSDEAFTRLQAGNAQARYQARCKAEQAAAETAAKAEAERQAVAEIHDRELRRTYSYWIVQRLRSRAVPITDPNRAITRYFDAEYMGSSEYEFGAPARSFKEMRALGAFTIRSAEITLEGTTRTVYFVGPTHDLELKIEAFRLWLDPKSSYRWNRSTERTYFEAVFAGPDADTWDAEMLREGHIKTDAWWAFDANVTWTLEPELADKLLAGLNSQPA